MFAWFIHRLTLLAFTAHAVLGCCWHHAHTIASECCGGKVATSIVELSEAAGPVCGPVGHECGCHAVAHAEVVVAADSLGNPRMLSGYEAPCDESHPCSEARCRYVATKLQPLEVTLQVTLGAIPLTNSHAWSVSPVMVGGRILERSSYMLSRSSGEHCAHLQSWQI